MEVTKKSHIALMTLMLIITSLSANSQVSTDPSARAQEKPGETQEATGESNTAPLPIAPQEAVISIKSNNSNYLRAIHALSSNLIYPIRAKQDGKEGQCILSINFNRAGQISAFSLIKSSGFKILDEACLDAVRQTGSLPPIIGDEKSDIQSYKLVFPINFQLEN